MLLLKEFVKETNQQDFKETVAEYVKEALATRDFDCYGQGGLHSRTETLHGTVHCQLFSDFLNNAVNFICVAWMNQ